MLNGEIFGYQEEMTGEISGDRVHVRKTHIRSVLDAAVPPGQAIEFEFYAATFPFTLLVTHSGAHRGTTERRAPDSGLRDAGSTSGTGTTREPVYTRDTGVTRETSVRVTESGTVREADPGTVREAPQADEVRRTIAAAVGLDATPGGTGAVVMARRRPVTLPGGRFDLDVHPDPLPPPPDFVVPFEITLTPPGGLEPIVYTNPKYSFMKQWPVDTARIDPDYLKRARGKWRISVRNINEDARRMEVRVVSVHAVTPIGVKAIPLSLLNNLSAAALQKALPTIEYDGGNVVVSTPTHFLDLMGIGRVYSLGSTAAKILDDLPTFTPFSARLMSRADFIARLEARIADIHREFLEHVQRSGSPAAAAAMMGRRNNAVEACQASIATLRQKTDLDAAFCLVLEGMFTNPEVDIRYVGTVAEIENRIPQVGFVFNHRFGLSDVVTNLAVDLSPLLTKVALTTAALTLLGGPVLGLFALIGGVKLYNAIDDVDVEREIQRKLKDKGDLIAGYVKRAFERITDVGAVALDAKILAGAAADGLDALQVRYFTPSTARPPRPWRPTDDALAPPAEVLEIAAGEVAARPVRAITSVARTSPRSRAAIERLTRIAAEPPGPVPEGFEIASPETLARLDDHAAIVVVMMENRSYDHFFHDLPAAFPGRGYSGVPKHYRNLAPPGFREPFAPVRNTSIGLGGSLIFTAGGHSSDPGHNYDHTRLQIGGGTADSLGSGEMAGFAADFARQSDSPHVVMSYFALDDLPVYRGLVAHYPVCDRWFAALPVGTYPNRLSALQGNVPFLYNVHMDDPSLGYLEDYSIFDLFDAQGIPWKFFESDLGTIRLYDRYRLNVANVRPFRELDDTLRAAQAGAPLPRAMFIEPQFLFGNDDHPPMDVGLGQAFLREVIGQFLRYGQLDKVLFLVTYDEHGGFFDHVAPPGTPAAAAARGAGMEYRRVEPLYPQDPTLAPKCMGVRVPTLLLSKWTSPEAKHTLLDHTAILKTFLLHNRHRVSTEQFGRFGERVMKRGHLGQLLDLPSPRAIDYAAVASDIGYRPGGFFPGLRGLVTGRAAALTPAHPANVLRGIGQPRARTVRDAGG